MGIGGTTLPGARIGDERFRHLVEGVSDYAIVLLDEAGIVESWNAGVEHILGYSAEHVIGQHCSLFYPPEAQARHLPAHDLAVARERGRLEDEGWWLRRDGTRFWGSLVLTALRADGGRVTGFSAITRDLTSRRDAEALARESEERFRLIVEGVKDYAIFMLTPEGRIASWNAGAQNIKGYAASEVIGQHFSIFYAPDDIVRHWPDHELRVARETGRFEDEAFRLRKDGSRFWANVVITALRDAKGELRGFAKVTRDLTTVKKIEALQRSEQRMAEFLAMLGHELRNPLAPLRTALDILDRAPDDRAAIEWTRKVFGRQVQHLSRLVDDLLDVGRITSGKVRLALTDVNVAAVVAETVEMMSETIASRRHALTLDVPPQPAFVRGDAVRIAQVVSNLVGNASKYTPDGGRIEVSLECDAGFATLTVADNGIGIAPELLPRMFDLFVQGDRTLDRAEGGLGVGLTLVKRLSELHGGTVAAASPGTGHGSRFTVRLPLTVPVAAPAGEGRAASAAAHAFRILVVDDNADSADALAELLRMQGHEVTTAYDGVAALDRASAFAPDLVLLDLGLPRLSGYEVAAALRALPSMRTTMLVALTGYGLPDDARRVLSAGFDRHVVKPAKTSDLESILGELAARRVAAPAAEG